MVNQISVENKFCFPKDSKKVCFSDSTEPLGLASFLTSDTTGSQVDKNCSICINFRSVSQRTLKRQTYFVLKLEFDLYMLIFVSFQINCYGKEWIQEDLHE